MKKIACIIGTRPQLIKHAALLKELEKEFEVQTINTLQHYDEELNAVFKNELYTEHRFIDLPISSADFSSSIRLGKMIEGLSALITYDQPDAVIVYGDTDSTLAGALVANKNSIPLIHIEAGERSFNKTMPEESNRVIADYLSQIHFCSSAESIENLKKEGIDKNVFYSGDLMKDLLQSTSGSLVKPVSYDYIFCTIHRNYNKNNPSKLKELLVALNSLDKKILFALHPATLKSLASFEIDLDNYKNIHILAPLSYTQSISYQKYSSAIVTDSGGIQKEAYWLKKPCLTMRCETEWMATLRGNWNQLLYQNLSALPVLLNTIPSEKDYDDTLYGNGQAAKIITNTISRLI